MPFSAIENQAVLDSAAAERKRREDLARLQQDEGDLADQAAEQKAAAKTGPAGVLADLMGRGGKAAVGGDVLKNAQEDQFLNEQATRRLGQQANQLADRKAQLSVPPPSAQERFATMSAPLGRFATDAPTHEDLPELEALKNKITGTGVPRETSPGADRFYYREEPSRAAPGENVLSFTNRPEVAAQPGFRRYNSDSGAAKDLGTPGGGFGTIGSGGSGTNATQAAQGSAIDDLIRRADKAKLSPQEAAQDLVTQQPGWDQIAATSSGPGEMDQRLTEAVATGRMRPETASHLGAKYHGIGRQATQYGEFDPRIWREALSTTRKPGPGEAELTARTGGQAVPQAAAAEHAAVQDVLQPPQDAPGSTRSPSLAAESQDPRDGLLAGIFGAAQQGAGQVRGGGTAPAPETPPGLPAAAVRYGVPAAAALATGGASLPAQAAIGGAAGAGSELLAELMNGESPSGSRIGGAGLGGAVLTPGMGMVGRGLGRVARSVGSLGKRFASDIPGVWQGAPTLDVAGAAAQPGTSTAAAARAFAGSQGAVPPPTEAVPYLTQNLPALRGGAYSTTGARVPDEVMSIEDLIDQYLRQTRRALPPPMQ